MPDYKQLYLALFRASEQAINILIDAQRACEELYLKQCEQEPGSEENAEPSEQPPKPEKR